MMKKINAIKLLLLSLFFFFIFLIKPSLANAASLEFNPSSISTSAGQTFSVEIRIDTGGEQVTSSDVVILYNNSLLEATGVEEASTPFFPTTFNDLSSSGRAYVAGVVDSAGTYKTGTGTILSVIFRAKTQGSGDLRFDCTEGSTTDSNIAKNDFNATDIISCSTNGEAAIAVSASSSVPTATPIPTSRPATTTTTTTSTTGTTGTTTTTATQLPRSGILDNVVKYAVPGGILLLVGTVAKLLL